MIEAEVSIRHNQYFSVLPASKLHNFLIYYSARDATEKKASLALKNSMQTAYASQTDRSTHSAAYRVHVGHLKQYQKLEPHNQKGDIS